MEHKINQNFAKFLIDLPDFKGLELIPIEHEKADYNFSDRYTIKGFEVEWYKCPFEYKKNGMLFIQAVEKCVVKFKKVPAYTTIGYW